MAKKKGWKKQGRRLINPINKTCMGVVQWTVQVEYWNDGECHIWADFAVNEDGRFLNMNRKADLRILRGLRAELDKYEEAFEEALEEKEAHNAASKKSTKDSVS